VWLRTSLTRFWGRRCLRGMETLPEDDIYESRARFRRGGEDRLTVIRLGDPAGGRDVDVEAKPKSLRPSDAVTVVLPPRERVWLAGRLRAPRVAAVTLVVLGAGISIRLLRRPNGHGGSRSPAITRHVAGVQLLQRERGAVRSAHHRIAASARPGARRQRRAGPRRAGAGERGARTSPATEIVPARVRPVPVTPTAGYVPQGGIGPAVDDAPPPVRSEPRPAPASRRRPPCVPGTLGC
jgi:hypothetical protein